MEGHAWFWILFGVLWLVCSRRGWAWGACGDSRNGRGGWRAHEDASSAGAPVSGEPHPGSPRQRPISRRGPVAPDRSLAGETPVEALQRRFVQGQLTVEEYEEKLSHLFRPR